MKIHYRTPNLIEQMLEAIANSKKPIDYFELTAEEFNQNFSSFDKSKQRGGDVQYSFKRIPIKVTK
jgi:predicted dithiol-disulfide oxidoreductase (DUF899 family)